MSFSAGGHIPGPTLRHVVYQHEGHKSCTPLIDGECPSLTYGPGVCDRIFTEEEVVSVGKANLELLASMGGE